MSTTQKTPSKSVVSKKQVRHQIALKLEKALADLKKGMGEKKFKSRIKKASKLFVAHYPIKTDVKATSKAAPAKKALKKVPIPPKKAASSVHA
jgi:hypothetical protein